MVPLDPVELKLLKLETDIQSHTARLVEPPRSKSMEQRIAQGFYDHDPATKKELLEMIKPESVMKWTSQPGLMPKFKIERKR